MADAEQRKLKRLARYFEWCAFYQTKPVSEVAVAFRLHVVCLELPQSMTPLDLLPLAEMLKYDNVILTLDAHRARLGNAGCYVLADALLHNTTLGELNLNFNDIGDHGASALARGLERNHALQRVLLRGNRISTAGAAALAKLLRRTRALCYLDLSNNLLRVRGVHELTHALVERAQARLSKRLAASAAAEASAAAAAAAVSTTSGAEAEGRLRRGKQQRPPPLSGGPALILPPATPRSGSGLGWLWGGPEDLVVTNDSVVRTDWGSFASSFGRPPEVLSPAIAVTQTPSSLQQQSGGGASSSSSGGGGRLGRTPSVTQMSGGGGDFSAASRRLIGGVPAAEVLSAPSISAASASAAPSSAAAGTGDEDLDIEVRISGNFVHEEIFNSIIHGVGLAGSILGAFPLLSAARSSGDGARLGGCILYVIGLVTFYASSTLNHSLFLTDARHVFRLIDHSAVYLLIAGTYSPFLLVNLGHTPLSRVLLAAVWFFAAVGVLVSTRWTATLAQQRTRVAMYVLIGWIGILPFVSHRPCLDDNAWWLLSLGGAVYSCGILVYLRHRVLNPHSIQSGWYLMVLAASAMHWLAVHHYVLPPNAQCLSATLCGGGEDARTLFGQLLCTDGGGGLSPLPLIQSACSSSGSSDVGECSPVRSAAAEAMSVAAASLAHGAASAAADSKRVVLESTVTFLRQVVAALEGKPVRD